MEIQYPREVVLLELDKPTASTGNIYPKATLKKWLKSKDRKTEFLGELGQKRCSDAFSRGERDLAMSTDPTNVCVKVTDLRLDSDKLMGMVSPHPPLGNVLVEMGDQAEFSMRALVKTRKVGEELHRDIVDIVAFDLSAPKT